MSATNSTGEGAQCSPVIMTTLRKQFATTQTFKMVLVDPSGTKYYDTETNSEGDIYVQSVKNQSDLQGVGSNIFIVAH